jgi:hypothetical protein
MIFLIIFWSILSFLIIYTIHYLINFLKDTLTVPKVKDLIYEPKRMYTEIESTLKSNNNNLEKNTINSSKNIEDNQSYIENNNLNAEDMKSELKNFFNDLKNEKLGKGTTTWDTVYSPNNF